MNSPPEKGFFKRRYTDKEKWCSRCEKWLSHDSFYHHPSAPSGLDAYCKACHASYGKEKRNERKNTPDGFKKYMLHTAKVRAQEQGVPFSLTTKDFDVPNFCPILGIKLEPGEKKLWDGSPSLDKIIPSLGYVPGNVRVISMRANRIKQNATSEELRMIADYIDSSK